MGESMMNQEQQEEIKLYVKNHIGQWIREQNILSFPQQPVGQNNELLERMIRVEESLKFQGETLKEMMIQSEKRFESMDKRFSEIREDMNTRFESIDKRFSEMREDMNKRFESVDKRFNRLYVFLSGIFLTLLAGFLPLIIKAIQ